MSGLGAQLTVTVRLHLRNRMGLLYGYLFPTIFLIAFWVLYRHESVPLARHLGELLTVTVLGGACFGLPTTLVSERERGVWRRYRLTPVPTSHLVTSTVVARYLLLVSAGILQVLLAVALGMPLPQHPAELWLAFTFAAFAFLGLGLVIATLADNVPAVQALGQCVFLPMLIIGGVAVRLERLPEWAQHLSAYFPGRYAVQAMQATVTGDGLGTGGFDLLALAAIGAAGCLAGGKMFRWDAGQRFASQPGKAWVAVAAVAWIAVGALAEARGVAVVGGARLAGSRPPVRSGAPRGTLIVPRATPTAAERAADRTIADGSATRAERSPGDTTGAPAPTPPSPAAPAPSPADPARPWEAVTPQDIEANLSFDNLPPDEGVVTPIAPAGEAPDPYVATRLKTVRALLPVWGPGQVADPVQRVRNYLYVAAVPDLFQMEELEPYLPLLVFEHLQRTVPRGELVKILYWIALHPGAGNDAAADELRAVGVDSGGPSDIEELRSRTAVYAVKLLGRLLGKIDPG